MKNVNRVEVYKSEKEFATGRLGTVIGSTFVSGIIVMIVGGIFGAIFGTDSTIVTFIRTALTSILAGGVAVEVLLAYREDRSIRFMGFLTIVTDNIASFALVAVVMGVINSVIDFVSGMLMVLFLGNAGLGSIVSIIMFIFTIYVSCATAFKYYLVNDKQMGVEAIFESFKATQDVIFDIVAVTVRYMWIPVVIAIVWLISSFSLLLSIFAYGADELAYMNNLGGSIGLFFIGLIAFLIAAVYFGARLVIANGILYSQAVDEVVVEDQGIVGVDAVVAEAEVVETVVVEEVVEVVEPEVVVTEVVEEETNEN